MSFCPVTGRVCDKPTAFLMTEQLGDKTQSTSCCRDCAAYWIQQRNNVALSNQVEQKMAVSHQAMPINDFISMILGAGSKGPQKACSCGFTFERILEQGSIGCARCYETFSRELEPYIAKTQGNATQHIGKKPQGGKLSSLPIVEQLEILQNSMQIAVEEEDYDRAAKFRDMIKKLKESINQDPGL